MTGQKSAVARTVSRLPWRTDSCAGVASLIVRGFRSVHSPEAASQVKAITIKRLRIHKFRNSGGHAGERSKSLGPIRRFRSRRINRPGSSALVEFFGPPSKRQICVADAPLMRPGMAFDGCGRAADGDQAKIGSGPSGAVAVLRRSEVRACQARHNRSRGRARDALMVSPAQRRFQLLLQQLARSTSAPGHAPPPPGDRPIAVSKR
jgi:hypothetical protein